MNRVNSGVSEYLMILVSGLYNVIKRDIYISHMVHNPTYMMLYRDLPQLSS